MGDVDLGAGWDQFWVGLGFSEYNTFFTVLGVLIFVVGLGIFIVKKLRNTGSAKMLIPWAIVAVVISSPTIAIPLVLDIVSAVLNIIIGLVNGILTFL